MTSFLLYFLLGELALMILWGLWRPSRVYQFPFLAGCVFALWAWPQFYQLHASASVPDGMLDKALVMTGLCSGMCYFGYQKGTRPIQKLNWAFDRNRLIHGALVMTLIGSIASVKFANVPEDQLSSQMTGAPVMFLFFAEALNFGFALSLLILLRRFSWWSLLPFGLGALNYLQCIIFGGRREQTIQFVLIIGILVWFISKKVPPRLILACGILTGAFLSYNISAYRSAMHGGSVFTGGGDLDALKNLKEVTEKGTEMRNAVYYIAATESLGSYDFGLFHWNLLIFRNFPAQIFGRSVKKNLMSLGGLLHIGENAERASGYQSDFGSTTGGITDAFASFWYFGCLEFFGIGYCMRRVYESALGGALVWQLGCALLTVYSLLAVTHTTNHFVTAWQQAALFLGPVLIYSRVRPGERNRDVIAAVPACNGRMPQAALGVRARQRGRISADERKVSARFPRFAAKRWKRRWLLLSQSGGKQRRSRPLGRLSWDRSAGKRKVRIGNRYHKPSHNGTQ